MKNRIALKLLLYFAAALVVYAGISGILFQTLFTRHTMETKRAEMLTRATALAQTLSLTLTDSGEGGRQSGAQGATGQLQAIGYANQLASSQANQLLQIRGLLISQQNAIATRNQALADNEAKQQAASDKRFAVPGPSNPSEDRWR